MDEKKNEIILFENQEVRLEVNLKDETVWLTQEQMSKLFGKAKSTINEHIKNVYKEGELKVIGGYSKALNLLDDYDHRTLKKIEGNIDDRKIKYQECINIINKLRFNEESSLDYDIIICSPLIRAKHTAKIINAKEKEILIDNRLEERNPGSLSEQSLDVTNRVEYQKHLMVILNV